MRVAVVRCRDTALDDADRGQKAVSRIRKFLPMAAGSRTRSNDGADRRFVGRPANGDGQRPNLDRRWHIRRCGAATEDCSITGVRPPALAISRRRCQQVANDHRETNGTREGPPTRRGLGFGHAGYDVAPDGRLLIVQPGAEEAAPLRFEIVLNWFEELKQRVPVGSRDQGSGIRDQGSGTGMIAIDDRRSRLLAALLLVAMPATVCAQTFYGGVRGAIRDATGVGARRGADAHQRSDRSIVDDGHQRRGRVCLPQHSAWRVHARGDAGRLQDVRAASD